MSLVPNATQTAPGAPIYAPVSGGGGGGGGSNFNSINVSSINFPSLGAPTQINFQPGVAVTNADTVRQTCASALSSYISIDPFGNDTPSSNAGILINGSNVASLELSCGSSTSAVKLFGGGNYLSIDTCIPNAYRIQFLDSGVGANPGMSTIGTLAATAIGGFKMLDSNLSTWTLSLSSLNVSSINGAAPGGGGSPNLAVSTLTAAQFVDVENTIDTANKLRIQTINPSTFSLGIPSGGSGSLTIARAPNVVSVQNADFQVSTITGQQAGTTGAAAFVLLQESDGSGRSQLAYNKTDGKGFGTFPFLCPTVPAGIDMGNLCCALDSNANPAGFGIGGNGVQGALVFNDYGGNNDDWIIGGGGTTTHYASNAIRFSTIAVNIPTGMNVSSINVSSINGAAPGGGGAVSQSIALANNSGNQISVPGNMTPGVFQQCSQGYSVVAGNTYELHAVIDLSGAIDGRFDMVVYGAGVGALPETVWSFPNDNTVKGQGVSCVFKPGNSGTVFVGATNTATNVSDNVLFTVGAANWVFTNLGAI